MRLLPLAAFFWMATAVSAQDAQLAALHATLVTLHSYDPVTPFETLGPELTAAKHQLRDWIETQLSSLKNLGDEKALSDRMNEALKTVDATTPSDDQNLLGSLDDVHLSTEPGMLIVTTGVGILCQFDESAYGYKRVNDRWQRVWEAEQNDYSEKNYAPLQVITVHVQQSFKDGREDGPAYVMTLANEWGCASTWHGVFWRVWRVDALGPKLMIDDSGFAWLRSGTYIVGSIVRDSKDENAPVDALIEFTEMSVDGGVHNREAIRHYLIKGDQVRRVDPVALSPRDFVDEWLTRSWNESAVWSASAMLLQWHGKLHADFVTGRFTDLAKHCRTPDLWQVTFEPHDAKRNFQAEPEVYFLVRWRPPYYFKMMGVSGKPSPRCTEEDREADEWRTLFASQDWRQ